MSLIPGPQGTKVQLVDGVQTDSISALTSGNGVQLEGRTSGVAVAAGYIGQVRTFTSRTITGVNQTTYTASAILDTLPAGVWQLFGRMAASPTGATLFSGVAYSTNGNNDGSGIIGNTTTNVPGTDAPIHVYIVNTNTNYPVYAKAFVSIGTGATVAVSGFAIRIA